MDAQRKIFSDLEKINPELLEKVKSLIFTFFDFAHLDPRSLERVLHEVDNLDLAMAIRGAPPAVIENVERCMSERRRMALQKEMEYMGDVTTDMVEKAQKKMLDTYFRLEETAE
jgi:flagellar motor switch protein FliG